MIAVSIDETTILASDLEDARFVLEACLTYFQARDMEVSQLNFTATRNSPLTLEVARVKKRLDGVFGDYLLRQHESDSALYDDEDDLDAQDDLDEAEDGSEELTEAPEEVLVDAILPDSAFGEPKVKRQSGRRLTASEAAGDA